MLCGVIAVSGCNKLVTAGSGDDGADASTTTGALTRESHGMYFPIGSGSYHPTETCDDCHGGFATYTQYTCMSCHAHATDVAQTRHTFITDFKAESSACYKCHPNGRETAISVTDHTAKYFPIDTGPHAALECSDCHNWTTTSRPFTCLGCHAHDPDPTGAAHAAITGYRYDSNGCFGCHPNGGEVAVATSDHSAQYFPILTGSHTAPTVKCADCHTDPKTSKTFVCTTCHAQSKTQTQHPGTANYAWSDVACYNCHPQDK
jgi:Zn finger protein HypA/HybF involved in hydrogenase expression